MEMQNSAGQKLHRCAECKGRGTWLVCSKIKERKPTKKDARTSFLDQRKYPFAIRMRSLLETHGYTCNRVSCTVCGGSGVVPEPKKESQGELI